MQSSDVGYYEWSCQFDSRVRRIDIEELRRDLEHRVTLARSSLDAHNVTISRLEASAASRRALRNLVNTVSYRSAAEARARAHRELTVLVPLMKWSRIVLEQWGRRSRRMHGALPLAASILDLAAGRVREHPFPGRRWPEVATRPGSPEQLLARELVRAHPALFYPGALGQAESIETAAAAPVASEPAVNRAELLRRITEKVSLTDAERRVLVHALLKESA